MSSVEKKLRRPHQPKNLAPRAAQLERLGQIVEDPFAFIEEKLATPLVRNWLNRQTAYTQAYLETVPSWESWAQPLTELNQQARVLDFQIHGDHTVFLLRMPGEAYAVLCDAHGETLIDPNLNEQGEIDSFRLSDDGEIIAYTTARGGNELDTLRFFSMTTGQILSDEIPQTRNAAPSWSSNSQKIYYARTRQITQDDRQIFCREIFCHQLGEDWQKDLLIYSPTDPVAEWPMVQIYDNESAPEDWYVLISTNTANDYPRFFLGSGSDDAPVPKLEQLAPIEDVYAEASLAFGLIYLLTEKDAPNRQILTTPIDTPNPTDWKNWSTLLPEESRLLESFGIIGDTFPYLIAEYLQDEEREVEAIPIDDNKLDLRVRRPLELPLLGDLDMKFFHHPTGVMYSFGAPDVPQFGVFAVLNQQENFEERVVHSLHLPTELVSLLPEIQSHRVWVTSHDGTQVPVYVFAREAAETDLGQLREPRKMILHGYGGFGTNEQPAFSFSQLLWLAKGHALAFACLRGGGEYGDRWHRAGSGTSKQNSFLDFIAAAETLISTGETRPESLGIMGASNGGLLVGAATVMRPELFGAAVADVGLYDFLAHTGNLSQYWHSEYTELTDPANGEFLRSISPYHQLQNREYPATLLMTGLNDTRVDPAQTIKFFAGLRAANTSSHPILLDVGLNAGHLGGTYPEEIAQRARVMAFFEEHLVL